MKKTVTIAVFDVAFYFFLVSYLLAKATLNNSLLFTIIFSLLLLYVPIFIFCSIKFAKFKEYFFIISHLIFSILITEFILNEEINGSGIQIYLVPIIISQLFSIEHTKQTRCNGLAYNLFFLYLGFRFCFCSVDHFIQMLLILFANILKTSHSCYLQKEQTDYKYEMTHFFFKFYPMFTVLLKEKNQEKSTQIFSNFPYELNFVNDYASKKFGVKDSYSLLKILENIQLNSNDILNSEQSPNYSPTLKTKKFGKLSNYFRGLMENPKKNFPTYQKFLVTYTDPIASSSNNVISMNIKQNQYRVILIIFENEGKLHILMNMENSNLEDQLKKFKEMDTYKDQMLASITHDLKSPLSSVITLIDTAKQIKDNEERRKHLDYAIHNGNMLLHQINEILDYSQMKMGKFNLFFSNFSLNTLIDDVFKLMKVQADLKGIHLKIENHCQKEQNPNFFSDFRRLKQVLINLIGNSLKFTTVGKIIIKISDIDTPNLLKFEVIDTGIGMKEETIKKLGKPFHSFGHENNLSYEGFGLGLYNCQTIVGQIGPFEKLHISSHFGSGSKFGFLVYLVCDKKSQKFYTAEQLDDIKKKNPLFFGNFGNVRVKSDKNRLDEEFSAFYSNEFCSSDFDEKKNQIATNNYLFSKNTNNNDLKSVPSLPNNKEFKSIGLNMLEKKEENLLRNFSPNRKKSIFGKNNEIKKITHETSLNEIVTKIPFKVFQLLLVDDDPFILLTLKTYIKQFKEENADFDIEFDEALNGQKAYELFREKNKKNSKKPYDLIFLDCQMPIRNGFSTCSLIKNSVREEKFIDTAVIGCSALNAQQEEPKCLEVGMNLFIEKPVKYETFKKVLTNQLKK